MDDRTGELYSTKEEALNAGVPERYVVEISGDEKAIQRVARRIRMASRLESLRARGQQRQQRMSRRRHRRQSR